MKLVLKVWSCNEHDDGGCDFALVELTPAVASLAIRRIGALKKQKETDEDVYETYFWNDDAAYFTPWLNRSGQPSDVAASRGTEETLEELGINEAELIEVPEDFQPLEHRIASVECGQMVVREERVTFAAIPKHCSFYVESAEVPVARLRAVAGAA